MKPIDLTHTFSIHTPGWVGYPSPKLSYFQRLATHGIVSQWLELPLHSGTHLDGELHYISGGNDMRSIPIDRLCREGVIVDISDAMEDWTVITPEHITERAEVRKGDILLYHTGYHRYYNGRAEEDEERYFLRHPGGHRELAEWIVEMELAWTGFDCASGDHPMNTSIRDKRPDARKAFEKQVGKSVDEAFPEEDLFVMHEVPFRNGITHLENMGGDIDQALGQRCTIGAFPIPIEGGEASPCRLVAFVDE
ncbi:MAG: cyclase family protein [Solirubrobacterales bacterium]|nr:cyclase family protein [Solirubrobacterales bacterium]